MNTVLFSPAFAQLIGQGRLLPEDPAPRAAAMDMAFRAVSLPRPASEPLMFEGRLLLDHLSDEHGLQLYETTANGLVLVLELVSDTGAVTRRVFTGATPEALAADLATLDGLSLVDVALPEHLPAREALRELHSRVAAVQSALKHVSDVLNVDVSGAILRLAALCDGDQTWLQ
jgi:hypothetical protein